MSKEHIFRTFAGVVFTLIFLIAGVSSAEVLTGAIYYTWYNDYADVEWDNGMTKWDEGYITEPMLGFYSSKDPDVIDLHIKLAKASGIDYFMIDWWNKHDYLEDTILNHMLQSEEMDGFQFAIMYNSDSHLRRNSDDTIDFDSTNMNIFLEDIYYIAQTYFSHPNYLTIDGRPVLFLYQASAYIGNIYEAVATMRNVVGTLGFDVYVIGDLVTYWQGPEWKLNRFRAKQFDAISTYTMFHNVPDINENWEINVLKRYFGWHIMAKSIGVDFIPNIMPGYNDTAVRPEANHPVIERDPGMFRLFCDYAVKFARANNNMLLITSWNEWHEHTQIEPDRIYRYDYLKVIRDCVSG